MELKNTFSKISIFLCLSGFICAEASSAISFLPASGNKTGEFRAAIEDACSDYVLSEPKCDGKECAEGWVCESCSNATGMHYKCEQVKTPDGYIAGVTTCNPCSEYFHNGFTGDLINGRCIQIKDCSENEDVKHTPFHYINGVEVGDDEMTYFEKTGYKAP